MIVIVGLLPNLTVVHFVNHFIVPAIKVAINVGLAESQLPGAARAATIWQAFWAAV